MEQEELELREARRPDLREQAKKIAALRPKALEHQVEDREGLMITKSFRAL